MCNMRTRGAARSRGVGVTHQRSNHSDGQPAILVHRCGAQPRSSAARARTECRGPLLSGALSSLIVPAVHAVGPCLPADKGGGGRPPGARRMGTENGSRMCTHPVGSRLLLRKPAYPLQELRFDVVRHCACHRHSSGGRKGGEEEEGGQGGRR